MNEHALRRELVRYSHLLYERHLLVAMDGNVSARLSEDRVLCSRAGTHKGLLTEDDLIVVDASGKKLRGRGEPTSEIWMHLAIYEERADVGAVLHAHPPHLIAFTLADRSLERLVLPEVVLTLGTIPTVPYATTGTRELADALRPYVRTRDVVMMDRHGVVSLGRDVNEAFCRLETAEHTARIVTVASGLGGVKELDPEESVRLRAMGLRRYGGPPDAVALAGAPQADLPPEVLASSNAPWPTPAASIPSSWPHVEVASLQAAIEREVAAVLDTRTR